MSGECEWSNKLSIGDHDIDADHHVIVDIITKINLELYIGCDRGAIIELFCKLFVFSRLHFEREEKLMERIFHGKRKAHFEEHAKMLDTLNNIRSDYEASGEIDKDTAKFICDMFYNHIIVSDMLLRDDMQVVGGILGTEESINEK